MNRTAIMASSATTTTSSLAAERMASNSTSTSTATTRDKELVLFGKTGDGKSTLANVLVTGGITEEVFEASDSARGCTSEIKRESGRGWSVIDTVGLGEAEMGNTSHAEAKEQIVSFLKKVQGSYSHIIYVQKARRLTTMEELIWKLFAKIFEGAEGAFVVVITKATPAWFAENKPLFPAYWDKVDILFTDIPPIDRKKPSMERRLSVKREQAIRQLEADLTRLFEMRGKRYYTPHIATMNEEQLETQSLSLLQYIVTQIKRLFESDAWVRVAARLSSLVKLSEQVLDVILLAPLVKDYRLPPPANKDFRLSWAARRGGEPRHSK